MLVNHHSTLERRTEDVEATPFYPNSIFQIHPSHMFSLSYLPKLLSRNFPDCLKTVQRVTRHETEDNLDADTDYLLTSNTAVYARFGLRLAYPEGLAGLHLIMHLLVEIIGAVSYEFLDGPGNRLTRHPPEHEEEARILGKTRQWSGVKNGRRKAECRRQRNPS